MADENRQALEAMEALETRQRVAAMRSPFGRRKLSVALLILLWVLRVYVILAVPLVIYAFIHSLGK